MGSMAMASIAHCFPSIIPTSSLPPRPSSSQRTNLIRLKAKSTSENEAKVEVENHQQRPLYWLLWGLNGVYVGWLFLLPWAPGNPVWATGQDTWSMVLNLSINFFLVLPLSNLVGFHAVEAPALHPTAEALFNILMGWSMMFAPLLFTDKRRDRFEGSLTLFWAGQMFLTNAFLIPYMAIRLSEDNKTRKDNMGGLNGFEAATVSNSRIIAIVGGVVGFLSIIWGVLGRQGADVGQVMDRWNFFLQYVSTDRVAYSFIWDLCLYSVFQPWLILSNINNVEPTKVDVVRILCFFPYLGLVTYLWGLQNSVVDLPQDET